VTNIWTKLGHYFYAGQDYLYWQKTDRKILKPISELIKDIQKTSPKNKINFIFCVIIHLNTPKPLAGQLEIAWGIGKNFY